DARSPTDDTAGSEARDLAPQVVDSSCADHPGRHDDLTGHRVDQDRVLARSPASEQATSRLGQRVRLRVLALLEEGVDLADPELALAVHDQVEGLAERYLQDGADHPGNGGLAQASLVTRRDQVVDDALAGCCGLVGLHT